MTPRRSVFWVIGHMLCRIAATLAFDLKARGAGHMPRHGGVLLVSNHQSFLDPVLLGVPLRRPICHMARASLFKNRFFGSLIRSLHAFPVRQGEADMSAMRQSIDLLRQGNVVNVFPEGSRTRDGRIGPLMPGIGLIVRRGGVPVVPAVVRGAFEAWPIHRHWPRPWPVRIAYGPPLHLSHLKPPEIVKAIDQALHRLFEQLGDPA